MSFRPSNSNTNSSSRRSSVMPPANDQTTGSNRSVQKASLAKLAKSFARKNAEKRAKDSWSNLIKNALILQRGKIPLLLAVEAGNQSMVRELLSAQTADQLKVSNSFFCVCAIKF